MLRSRILRDSKATLHSWHSELALQAVSGSASDCTDDVLVRRSAGVRGRLSGISPLRCASHPWPDHLHGLDFAIAHASLVHGDDARDRVVCRHCDVNKRPGQAVRPTIQDH